MTPPSNAGGEGREVLAREVLAEQLHGFGELRRAILSGDDVKGDPMIGPAPAIAAMLAFSARENADDRAAYTYDVTWSRADGERLTCRDLSPRLVTARIIQAIKTSGPITIHAVEGRADDRAVALVEVAVAEEGPPDEDWLTDVLDDSLDMDWTGRVGARAIIARWSQRHD